MLFTSFVIRETIHNGPAAPSGSGDPKLVPKVSYICGSLRPPLISNQELQNNFGEQSKAKQK